VLDSGTRASQAWIRGAFQGSRDAPDCRSLWPADYALEVTYTLADGELRLEAVVTNPDRVPLPLGFGLHPYHRFPADQALFYVEPSAQVEQWPLSDYLPAGNPMPLDDAHRPLAHPGEWKLPSTMTWDDAFRVASGTATVPLGTWLVDRQRDLAVRMEATGGFRDLVVFTPPHRQAVCLEPYTCITDAINLQARGFNTGLMVLPPGESWRGTVTWTRSPAARR
jgi:aldose 1-epimerase